MVNCISSSGLQVYSQISILMLTNNWQIILNTTQIQKWYTQNNSTHWSVSFFSYFSLSRCNISDVVFKPSCVPDTEAKCVVNLADHQFSIQSFHFSAALLVSCKNRQTPKKSLSATHTHTHTSMYWELVIVWAWYCYFQLRGLNSN